MLKIKKILLVIVLTLVIFQMVVLATEITMGIEPIDRGASLTNRTMVNKDTPANGTGTITSIEIWISAYTEDDVEIGTFYTTGTNELSTRDYVNIGTVAAGSKKTITVDKDSNPISIDVVEGDYIGASLVGGIEAEGSGGNGIWYLGTGVRTMPCTEEAFTLSATFALSLQATGKTVEVGTHVFFIFSDF